MIRNPTYRGHRVDANGVTVHKCEALVDGALWQRANKALTVKPGKRGPISGQSAMLTSILFVAHAMTGARYPPCTGFAPGPGMPTIAVLALALAGKDAAYGPPGRD